MRRDKLSLLILSALALAAGAAGFLGGLQAWRALSATVTLSGQTDPGCDLQRGPCRARFAGGAELVVTVAPRPIPLVKPLTVDVEVHGLTVDSVEVDIRSPDMYMGYHRRGLRTVDAQRFSGQTVLPVCILDRMRWELRALARRGNTVHEAVFVFETVAERARLPA